MKNKAQNAGGGGDKNSSGFFNIECNALTPEIYRSVRATASMKSFKEQDVKKALENTLFSVVITENGNPVGIGRVIGDGSVAFFLKDVVVIPQKQGMGIGRLIMDALMGYIRREGADNAYVGLMATKGKEGFYEQFGFHVRPCGDEGSGMTLYMDQV